jgi:hypothetical protein
MQNHFVTPIKRNELDLFIFIQSSSVVFKVPISGVEFHGNWIKH